MYKVCTYVILITEMRSELRFEWDSSNVLAGHNVTQAEFEEVMRTDPILFEYTTLDGEDRWTGMGSTKGCESWSSRSQSGTVAFVR
jgi:hypothetical protein